MTVSTRELINAVSVLTNDHNIRATTKSSLKAGAIVGSSTFVGAMLGGPPGIVAGAVLGGVGSYFMAKDSFKSVALIIRDDLTAAQRERLCQHIHEAFREFGLEDVAMLLTLLSTNPGLKKLVLEKVVHFFTNEMQMQIID